MVLLTPTCHPRPVAEITSTVDAYWSDAFGIPIADLHSPGVRVHPHRADRAAWRTVYVLVLGDAASVFAPDALCGPLSAALPRMLAGQSVQTILDPALWRAVLGDHATSVLGPAVHLYLTDRSSLAGLAEGRRLNPGDTTALAALRSSVAAEEWEQIGRASCRERVL